MSPQSFSPFQIVIWKIDEYLRAVENVQKQLKNLKSRVKTYHKGYQIASTVFDGTSIVGSVATIAGVLLTPVTAGVSLALTAGGLGATVGGGVASATSCFVNAAEIK